MRFRVLTGMYKASAIAAAGNAESRSPREISISRDRGLGVSPIHLLQLGQCSDAHNDGYARVLECLVQWWSSGDGWWVFLALLPRSAERLCDVCVRWVLAA